MASRWICTAPGNTTINAVDSVARALAAAACQANGTNCPMLAGPQVPLARYRDNRPTGTGWCHRTARAGWSGWIRRLHKHASAPLLISGSNISLGVVPTSLGGTTASDAVTACTNLGLRSMAVQMRLPSRSPEELRRLRAAQPHDSGDAQCGVVHKLPGLYLVFALQQRRRVRHGWLDGPVNHLQPRQHCGHRRANAHAFEQFSNFRVVTRSDLGYILPGIGIDGTGFNWTAVLRSGQPVALEQIYASYNPGQPSGKWIQQHYSTTTGRRLRLRGWAERVRRWR